MPTKLQPWPRKANSHRKQSVMAAIDILEELRPLIKNPLYQNDPVLMATIARVTYQARDIIDLLTSIPAEDERKGTT